MAIQTIYQGNNTMQIPTGDLNYWVGQGWSANQTPQAPQQPSLPQGAPQGSVAIPGAQYNTQALQQANFSQITPIGNTLYGVPNVASNLTSSQLTGGTPNVPAATANNQTSPEGTVAGANQYMTQLQADLAAQQAQQQALESRLTAGQTSANDLLAQIGQKGTEYQSELEKYNYTANVAQLQDINRQIASKTAEFQNAITAQEGRVASASSIYGRQALLQRQQASEVGGLSAIAQALQGNITLAQNTAKDAINVKYEPMENQLKQQLQQIEFLYNDLSRADQKKADAQTALLNERLRVMEEQKNTEENISNIVLTAAQKGADMNTLNSIRNAKTLDEAILVASGATPILTPAGLAGLTENDIMRVGSKIYRKGKNWLTDAVDNTPQKIGTDANGQDLFYDPATNTVKTANQLSGSANLGNQVGTIMGLPAYDTRAANPGISRSDRNNNPGNIKASDFTKNWEGVIGVESSQAQDGGNFLIFDSPESGINAIGKLLMTGGYAGMTAERAIKRYNGGGTYGAASVGLDPNRDLQSQLQDPVKRQQVAMAIARAEGFTGSKSSTAESYAKLIQSGQLKLENVPTEDRQATAQLLATMANPKDTANDIIAKEKAQLALDLKTNAGLSSAVGPVGLARVAMPWQIAAKQDFIAGVEQLVSGLSLEALIQAKSQGATFGALSDSEMRILASSATRIGTWALRDETGKVKGYKASQASFKKELDNINKILLIGITSNLENNNSDPLGLGMQSANSTNPLGI